jgi:mRNA interferase MazF
VAPSSTGAVVLVRFPFSNLTGAKLRPAVVLAAGGRGDWLVCQVTSNAYADRDAVRLGEEDMASGSLSRASFARPGKLVTIHESVIRSEVALLTAGAFARLIYATTAVLHARN